MIPLSFFHWRVPFSSSGWNVVPWDYAQHDQWVPQQRYPVEIKPRSSATFFLSEIGPFRESMRNIFRSTNYFERCRLHFLSARVVTDDGKMFNVKLDTSLSRKLRTIRSGALSDQIG
jgi:hypothetical protein